jgi:DNA-directed RNA polymerase specialized sigma24 family protein
MAQYQNTGAESARRGGLEEAAASYLAHVVEGKSIRSIAQKTDVHPSTIMRRIRKVESLRDDPVLDQFLNTAAVEGDRLTHKSGGRLARTGAEKFSDADKNLLRRMAETGAVLVVSKGLKNAVVMRTNADGKRTRTAVVESHLAGSCVIKDWLRCVQTGKLSLYEITEVGRSALKRAIAKDTIKGRAPTGFAEAPSVFSEQHKDWGKRSVREEDGVTRKKHVNLRESPLTTLARKKDKNGRAFLSSDLIEAGDRLREDFELSQLGPRVGQNWERFLSGNQRGSFGSTEGGNSAAKDRLQRALGALGPGLGDIVMRCCCFLEGLEQAEKRMGWSARSGKIVLRIALQRLRMHYDTECQLDERRIG